jgi:hypothetical protein
MVGIPDSSRGWGTGLSHRVSCRKPDLNGLVTLRGSVGESPLLLLERRCHRKFVFLHRFVREFQHRGIVSRSLVLWHYIADICLSRSRPRLRQQASQRSGSRNSVNPRNLFVFWTGKTLISTTSGPTQHPFNLLRTQV